MTFIQRRHQPLSSVLLICLFTGILSLASCAPDNSFTFSKETKTVKAKKWGSSIKALFIQNNLTQQGYEILWTDKEHSAPGAVQLSPLTKGYKAYNSEETEIPKDSFRLQPFTKYTIERSDQGDAITCAIVVITGEDGVVDSIYSATVGAK